jgi:hypothetical protein
MAGISFTGADVEMRAGLVVANLWSALDDARAWYWWLQDHNSAVFTTLGITGDETTIRTAAGDLGGPSGLWSVAHSKIAPSGASDYFFTAKLLTGTKYSGSAIA